MSYDFFACCYDDLMRNVDYRSRAEYFLSLFDKFGSRPRLMLDAACGTGSFTLLMAQAGIDVIGVDISPQMLAVAANKAYEADKRILYLNQPLHRLDLYGSVDGVTCTLDSINHIVSDSELQKAFERIALFSEPGALFIFDANTPYKHSDVLADNTFVYETDDIFCVWQNAYDSETGSTDIDLDFFVRDGGGYRRESEHFRERAYSEDVLRAMLEGCGFEVLAVLGDMSFDPPSQDEQRMTVVAKRAAL